MSAISQNAPGKSTKRKKSEGKIETGDFPSIPSEEAVLAADLSGSEKSNRKKNKKNKKKNIDREDSNLDEIRVNDEEMEGEEEKKLEELLFGSIYSFPNFGKEGDEDGEVIDGSGISPFYFDNEGTKDLHLQGHESGEELRNSVWVDEEEQNLRVDVTKINRLRKLRVKAEEAVISGTDFVSRLRAQHVKLNPGTDWARIGAEAQDYDSSDDESGVTAPTVSEFNKGMNILQSTEDVLEKNSSRLLSGTLEFSRMVDANIEEPSNGPINSVQFHRNAQLLLAAGLDRRLRFFQIDGKRNTRIESIFIEDCPIRKAAFLPEGSQVIISGRRKFFYSFDLVKARIEKVGPLLGREEKSLESFEISPDSSTIAFVGDGGYILLVSSKTKNLIGTLKMNGTVRSLAFTDNSNELLSGGGDGHIYHWDLRTRRCFHKGVDDGCLTGSSLATSRGNGLFAAGSTSGIVNVYSREEFVRGERKPLKMIENLTTTIDCVKFNPDAQILAICSPMKKNALKLVHVPSFRVFSNWPALGANLRYPRCLDFSPNGGFMAVGNAAGKVLLYKLHHYHKA